MNLQHDDINWYWLFAYLLCSSIYKTCFALNLRVSILLIHLVNQSSFLCYQRLESSQSFSLGIIFRLRLVGIITSEIQVIAIRPGVYGTAFSPPGQAKMNACRSHSCRGQHGWYLGARFSHLMLKIAR